VILNLNGYYDPLLAMLQKCVDEQFMRPQHADIWKVATTAQEAVEMLLETPDWDPNVRKFAAI
jgi:hypothetical protein